MMKYNKSAYSGQPRASMRRFSGELRHRLVCIYPNPFAKLLASYFFTFFNMTDRVWTVESNFSGLEKNISLFLT